MFLCNDCHVDKDRCPVFARSGGACENCGDMDYCTDCRCATRDAAVVRAETRARLAREARDRDPGGTGMSPALRKYLALERAMLELYDLDERLTDALCSLMDPLWYGLSAAERAFLDGRDMRKATP